jgi:cyclopropane fatty-acyl-phospholipid synthase-like methyltransferase
MAMDNGVATPDEVGSFYDGFADMLVDLMGDSMHMGYWSGPNAPTTVEDAADRMTDHLIAELAVGAGGRVLDVGCGTGRPAVRLAQAVDVEVVGVTISRAQVEIATARAVAEQLADRVSFRYGNAMELPFPDRSFDAAWAVESLLHMPDRPTVLREIARVLRPGGRLVLADPVLRAPDPTEDQRAVLADFYDLFKVVHIPPIDDYPKLLRDSGFRLDRLTDVGDHTDRYRIGPRGWRLLAQGLRQNGALPAAKYGMSPEQHEDFLTRMAGLERLPDQGYLLVAAHTTTS